MCILDASAGWLGLFSQQRWVLQRGVETSMYCSSPYCVPFATVLPAKADHMAKFRASVGTQNNPAIATDLPSKALGPVSCGALLS